MVWAIVILVVVIAVVATVILVALARVPAAFRIARTIEVSAPPATVFAEVDDLHRWQAWSPWERLDPAMRKTFSGAAAGEGARYDWESRGKAGAGGMTIVRSVPDARVEFRLDFLRPFKATNASEFTFEPRGDGATFVTWTMTGRRPLMGRVFGLFVDIDKLVGGDFERGLQALKAIAEASPSAAG